jgi:hypothetical protein
METVESDWKKKIKDSELQRLEDAPNDFEVIWWLLL